MPLLETAAAIATITSVPLAAAPILKQKSALKACIEEADASLKEVSNNLEHIPDPVLQKFLELCESYIEARNNYFEKRANGKYSGLQWPTTLLKGREARKEVMGRARLTSSQGKRITATAFYTKIQSTVAQGQRPNSPANTAQSDASMESMGGHYSSVETMSQSFRTRASETTEWSQTSLQTEDIGDQHLHDGCPPQYDGLSSCPIDMAAACALGHSTYGQGGRMALSIEELSGLAEIYNNSRSGSSNNVPFPEERNAWEETHSAGSGDEQHQLPLPSTSRKL